MTPQQIALVQLRNAVWTGDTRDTRPNSDITASQNIGSRHSPSDGSDIPCGHADAARCQAPAPHANADAASLCSSPSG